MTPNVRFEWKITLNITLNWYHSLLRLVNTGIWIGGRSAALEVYTLATSLRAPQLCEPYWYWRNLNGLYWCSFGPLRPRLYSQWGLFNLSIKAFFYRREFWFGIKMYLEVETPCFQQSDQLLIDNVVSCRQLLQFMKYSTVLRPTLSFRYFFSKISTLNNACFRL